MKNRIMPAVLALALTLTAFSACNNEGGSMGTDSTTTTPQTDSSDNVNDTTNLSSKYEWDNVEIVGGGYTSGIYYNETEEGLVYARTDIGGAYRMDKESGEWIPLTDEFNESEYSLYGIDGMATDNVETGRVYCLAGMYTNGWLEMPNAVLLRSSDYGETWEQTALEFPAGGNEPNRFCDRLVIDPNDNKTIYLLSRKNGLYVSHDYGVTVTKVDSFPTDGLAASEDSYTFGITALACDKSSSEKGTPCNTIIVGTGDRMSYITTDGGTTWAEVEGHIKSSLIYHIEIVGTKAYFVFGSKAGPYQVSNGSIRYFDLATKEWTDITPESSGHGWGDLAIDPTNPDIMYASTMGKWGAQENDNMFRTTDGGKTWTPLFTGDGQNRIFEMDISDAPWLDWGASTAKLGWMMGCIALNPFNTDQIMYGTGATIYRSRNLSEWGSGKNVVFEVCCKGLEETAIMDLEAANSDEIQLYSAMGDIDGFSHKDVTVAPDTMNDNGTYGTTSSISCAYNDASIVARCGDNSKPVSISTDYGATWTNCKPEGSKGKNGTIEVNCDGSAIYWFDSGAMLVFASYDKGETWNALEKTFVNPTFEADKFNPDVLYVFSGGTLYFSKDKGATFTMSKTLMPDKAQIVSSPEAEGEVWVASPFGGVSVVKDYGDTTEVTKTTMLSAEALAFGAAESDGEPMAMYVLGTSDSVYGVWRSTDKGETWERINDDEHEWGSIGNTLAADYKVFGRVYLGTNGRGIIMGTYKG